MTPAQLDLLEAADRICRWRPCSVTSWWRSAKHNASLPGSVPNSQHQNGLAVDLVFDGPQPSKGELFPFLGPTLQAVYDEPGHVHLEQDPKLLQRLASAEYTAVASATRPALISPPTPSATPSTLSASAVAQTATAPSNEVAQAVDRVTGRHKRRT